MTHLAPSSSRPAWASSHDSQRGPKREAGKLQCTSTFYISVLYIPRCPTGQRKSYGQVPSPTVSPPAQFCTKSQSGENSQFQAVISPDPEQREQANPLSCSSHPKEAHLHTPKAAQGLGFPPSRHQGLATAPTPDKE